jgi:CBS domain-containing protein/sporulation protein YlmC with PRC-barrel domain
MTTPSNSPAAKPAAVSTAYEDYQLLYFSELLSRRIVAGKISHKVGSLTDLVFRLAEPYPEAVGLYVEHSRGRPNEFIPWDKVVKIEEDAIFITPAEGGGAYPSFVDQKGWLQLNEHLMGRTILDMDGRRTEVVNDIQFLYSKGRMIIVHVDTSFNGFLRKWGLGRLKWAKDQFISWRYVQPLSLEDAGTADAVFLSITHKQIKELPPEDLADALESLSGKEQTAVFSALDSETAAEVLAEAEPRAQRQLIANLRRERAQTILSEMSVSQIADLLSVLPHDQTVKMMELLSPEQAQRINSILSNRESTAGVLMSTELVSATKETKVGDILKGIRDSKRAHEQVSYIYVVSGADRLLLGVVDLRDLVLASDGTALADLMVSPVVSVQHGDVRDDLAELFAKYHFRMIPVVDAKDHLLGVIHYNDIMRGLATHART